MAKIIFRDSVWLLFIPNREAPMGFWTRESAESFANNNLRIPFAGNDNSGRTPAAQPPSV